MELFQLHELQKPGSEVKFLDNRLLVLFKLLEFQDHQYSIGLFGMVTVTCPSGSTRSS